jgi:iron complex outermembrane receptor protein
MAMLGTEALVNVDLIDHVEIVRGPSSSLYGTNALFGVINVITKRGRDYRGAELAADYGSLNSGKARATYGTRFAGGTEIVASLSAYQSDGEDRLYYEAYDDPSTNDGIAEDNDDDHARNVFLKLYRNDFSLVASHVRRVKEVPTASYDASFNDTRQETEDRQGYVAVEYSHTLETGERLSGTISYDAYRYDGTYPNAVDDGGNLTGELTEDYGDGRWWTAQLQLTGEAANQHRYVVGVDAQYNVAQDQGNKTLEPYQVFFVDKRSSRQWSVFLQDEWHATSNLLLNVGIRHDDYSEWGGTTNPRVALIYLATSSTSAKLMYGDAYRAPSPYELYYTPSPWLKPERIRTVEAALEHSLRPNLRAVASLFRYWMSDLINQQDDYTYANTGDAVADGVELELEGRLSANVDGRVSYSNQRARDTATRELLTNSPRQLAKVNLSAPLVGNTVFGGLEVQYVGARRTLAGDTLDANTLTNVTISSRGVLPGLDLSLSAYNVTDASYADPGGQEHVQDSITQDGRTYRIKVQYEFR